MSQLAKAWQYRIVACLSILALLVSVVSPAPAQAAVTPWTPSEKTIVTAPEFTKLKTSTAFIDEVCDAVKAAPAGTMIRVATYWSSDKDVINCFIAARKNKVNVRYTTWHDDYKSNKKLLTKLKNALQDKSGKSYFKVCDGSCYHSKKTGTQHVKAVTISEVIGKDKKTYKNISFVSSGNFSKKSSSSTWNYSTVFVGRAKLYARLASFMDKMKADKKQKVPSVITDGDTTLRFYPGGSDSVLATLKKIKSVKVGKGYGKNGKAVIRVVMYYWSGHHKNIARELARLKKLGADVSVAIKAKSTNEDVIKILKKAKIPLYNTELKKGTYSHGKVTVISARVGKKDKNLVFSGSVNLTSAAFKSNTEVAVEQSGAKYRDAGLNFYNLVQKYSKRI